MKPEPLLHYCHAERRAEWQGREWYLRPREAVILGVLMRFPGQWVPKDRIADALWPALRPDDWENAVSVHISGLAHQLLGTSARVERAGDHGTKGLGYRLVGKIQAVEP